jgi:hypothetical protein
MIWVAGLVLVYLTLAAMFVFGLLRGWRKPMPPFEPDGPWQHDPANLARCPGCGTLRPVTGGVIASHDRPQEWVPYDQASARCAGTGQLPQSPVAGTRSPVRAPLSPVEDSEARGAVTPTVEETGHLPPTMFAKAWKPAERAKPPGKWLAADDFQDPAVPVDAGHDGCRTSEANHPPVGGAAGPGPVSAASRSREHAAPTGRDTKT